MRQLSSSRSYATSVSTRAAWLSASPQQVQRRWFSATGSRRDDNEDSAPAKLKEAPKFPGAFGRAATGSFGSFANNTPGLSGGSSQSGLLPHEQAARQRATASQEPTPQQPKASKPNQSNSYNNNNNNNQKGNRANRSQKAARSKSVLADVFNSMREPRAPPTPASWSTTPASSEQDKSTGRNTKASPQNSRFKSHGGGLKNVGNQDKHAPAGRKKSTLWSEITGKNRHAKSAGPRERVTGSAPTSQSNTGSQAGEQDFWGELDNRLARKDEDATTGNRFRPRHPKAAGKGATTATESKQSNTADDEQGEVEKPRRKSRFEEAAEPQNDQRRNKKPQMRNSRRIQEDEDWDDETVHRYEQRQKRKAEKAAKKHLVVEEPEAVPIFLPEFISASNLAQALKQRVDSFLHDMEQMGFENVTSDTIMTGETAALIAMEYGFDPSVDSGSQRDLRPAPVPEDVSSLPSRPPVVTIMGHVDHGKTTLLDWLRKSSVAAQEHGGITQHIGAFIVKMSSGKQITFLDTPGHAAFLSMRQRGANVTDIVVLVVAADDSVMPQTLEALKHATAAKVPIIVAINKIDKEDARIDQVKADLSRHGVEIEDYGGDVQVVCVSGKTGQGMTDLEENIVTLSEVLDVRAENDGLAEGWILESSIKQHGKSATVLVKRGTLRPGDFIAAGKTWARIRVLRNEAGVEITEAPPGTPIEILGWKDLPVAGEMVLQSPDEATAKTAVEYRLEMAEREESSAQLAEQEQKLRDKAAAEAQAAEADAGEDADAAPSVLTQNFTVKADVAGSVEAVCASVLELGNNEVQSKILRSSAGQITEYDIDHAATSKSIIINFNSPIQPHIKMRAEDAKVKILDHTVIYHVVDDAKAALSDILPYNVSVRVIGEADILQVFGINVKKRVVKNIAGCRVRNGSIKRGSLVKVLRKGKVVFEGMHYPRRIMI